MASIDPLPSAMTRSAAKIDAELLKLHFINPQLGPYPTNTDPAVAWAILPGMEKDTMEEGLDNSRREAFQNHLLTKSYIPKHTRDGVYTYIIPQTKWGGNLMTYTFNGIRMPGDQTDQLEDPPTEIFQNFLIDLRRRPLDHDTDLSSSGKYPTKTDHLEHRLSLLCLKNGSNFNLTIHTGETEWVIIDANHDVNFNHDGGAECSFFCPGYETNKDITFRSRMLEESLCNGSFEYSDSWVQRLNRIVQDDLKERGQTFESVRRRTGRSLRFDDATKAV